MDDVVGAGEIQARAAGAQADEEYGRPGGFVPLFNNFVTLGRSAVEIQIVPTVFFEPRNHAL